MKLHWNPLPKPTPPSLVEVLIADGLAGHEPRRAVPVAAVFHHKVAEGVGHDPAELGQAVDTTTNITITFQLA